MAYWAVENQDKNLSGENYFRCSTLRKILLYIAQTSAYYWYRYRSCWGLNICQGKFAVDTEKIWSKG